MFKSFVSPCRASHITVCPVPHRETKKRHPNPNSLQNNNNDNDNEPTNERTTATTATAAATTTLSILVGTQQHDENDGGDDTILMRVISLTAIIMNIQKPLALRSQHSGPAYSGCRGQDPRPYQAFLPRLRMTFLRR